MSIEIRAPKIEKAEATVVRWLKKAGDVVTADDSLLELRSDRLTIDVKAPGTGILAEIAVSEGVSVDAGMVLGQIGERPLPESIVAKATGVFGTIADARAWLARPAIGLNQRRPIDLLDTPAGVDMVANFLEQLKYGVYV